MMCLIQYTVYVKEENGKAYKGMLKGTAESAEKREQKGK